MSTHGKNAEFSPAGMTRRSMLALSAAAVGSLALPARVLARAARARIKAAGEPIRLGLIGVGGQGGKWLETTEPVAAVCDVDGNHLQNAVNHLRGRNPEIKAYRDYRELLAAHPELDAVTITTPDHMHAPIALAALERGLHVYCEKPLTRTIEESRRLLTAARAAGAVTQMGNQGAAANGFRRNVEILKAGVIGPIREAHVWTNRPIWPQGIPRPEGEDAVPDSLSWDLWLGVAPKRPFKKGVYHGFNWRGWGDFGSGALGDMGCHMIAGLHRALELDHPVRISAEPSTPMGDSFPKSCTTQFAFDRTRGRPALTLWWYDGGRLPSPEAREPMTGTFGDKPSGSGIFLVGEGGWMFMPDDYADRCYIRMKGDERFADRDRHPAVKDVPVSEPRVSGHRDEWFAGIRGGPAPYMSFEHAAPLTEMVLLGNAALHAGRPIRWNPRRMSDRDGADISAAVKPHARTGW
jgi:predicted dehydrogenase